MALIFALSAREEYLNWELLSARLSESHFRLLATSQNKIVSIYNAWKLKTTEVPRMKDVESMEKFSAV